MTREEAKHKLDFMKKAYQKLIDEKVDSGKLVGDGVSGEWKAETPLDETYKSMIDALEMAIKALEPQYCGDCISREETLKALMDEWTDFDSELMDYLIEKVRKLPSVTPQPKMGHCKDCKYFEYDSLIKVKGTKLIFAHEVCSMWGDGCKTKEDGYCFLFEPKMQEVEE